MAAGGGNGLGDDDGIVLDAPLDPFAVFTAGGFFRDLPLAVGLVYVGQLGDRFGLDDLVAHGAVQLTLALGVLGGLLEYHPLAVGVLVGFGDHALFHDLAAVLALADALALFLAGGLLHRLPVARVVHVGRGGVLRPAVDHHGVTGGQVLIEGLSRVMGHVHTAVRAVAPGLGGGEVAVAPAGVVEADAAVEGHPVIHVGVSHQIGAGVLVGDAVSAGRRRRAVGDVACDTGGGHDHLAVGVEGDGLVRQIHVHRDGCVIAAEVVHIGGGALFLLGLFRRKLDDLVDVLLRDVDRLGAVKTAEEHGVAEPGRVLSRRCLHRKGHRHFRVGVHREGSACDEILRQGAVRELRGNARADEKVNEGFAGELCGQHVDRLSVRVLAFRLQGIIGQVGQSQQLVHIADGQGVLGVVLGLPHAVPAAEKSGLSAILADDVGLHADAGAVLVYGAGGVDHRGRAGGFKHIGDGVGAGLALGTGGGEKLKGGVAGHVGGFGKIAADFPDQGLGCYRFRLGAVGIGAVRLFRLGHRTCRHGGFRDDDGGFRLRAAKTAGQGDAADDDGDEHHGACRDQNRFA